MKTAIHSALLGAFSFVAVLHAELPGLLKPTAERFDEGMKGYDKTEAAMVKADRDAYLTVLGVLRKRSEGAKQTEAVAAIDLEIKAVNAGPITGEPPAHLPQEALRYRKQYVDAPEKAVKALASTRRFTREVYLKWLDDTAASVRRFGNDKALEAAVAGEKARVLASDPKAKEIDASKPATLPSVPGHPSEPGAKGK